MPTAKEFASEVDELALTITGYQNGKSGQNGLCDCIGLVMGAMTRLGRGSYPMHSTNYFARYQMDSLRILSPAEKLAVGQLVYKADDNQSDLNDRYKAGGRYYTGDMLNYYHVGVVTSVSPLEITHCTSSGNISGIKRDSSTKGWTHVGEMRGVDYAIGYGKEEAPTMSKTAFVVSDDGNRVRLRSAPTDTSYNTIAKVNPGTVVDVPEQAGEGATVITPDGQRGYMMTQFLKFLEYADEPDEDGQNQPSNNSFEAEVLQRFDRLETLLNSIIAAFEGSVG